MRTPRTKRHGDPSSRLNDRQGRWVSRWVLAVLLALPAVRPAGASVRRLTSSGFDNWAPQINRSGQVAWYGERGNDGNSAEIYFWDGSSVQRLTHNDTLDWLPAINDAGQVAWWGDGQVYLWDGSTVRQISAQPVPSARPQIGPAGQVVWLDSAGPNGQIYLWDGTRVRQISQGAGYKGLPVVNSAGTVGWRQTDGTTYSQMYLWKDGAVQALPRVPLSTQGPQIDDRGEVVWWGKGDDFRDHTFLWDGTGARPVPDANGPFSQPSLGPGGQIAWPGVLLWDRTQTRFIDDFHSEEGSLQLNRSGQVVWQSIGQIRYWNGTWLQTLTPIQTASQPQINDAGQVVWMGWDGAHTQIYLYTPSGPGSIDLLSPDPIAAGDAGTGTVILTDPAPAGGAVVSLSSSRPDAASVPASVTVPAGQRTATFPVATHPVPATTPVVLTASSNGAVWTTTVHVWHAALDSVTLSAGSLGGGVGFQGTVTLDYAAPATGITVALTSSSPAAVTVPPTAQVLPGQDSATFFGETHGVAKSTSVTISAALEGKTRTATLQVRGGQPALSQILLHPSPVLAGERAAGTVVLDGVAPAGGTIVFLSSSSDRAAVMPARLVVPAGQRVADFAIQTFPVTADITVRISAAANRKVQTASLVIVQPPLASLTLSPSTVTTGRTVIGTVRLVRPAPHGGAVVRISGTGPSVFGLSTDQVIVPEGAVSADFTVDALPVQAVAVVTVTASLAGQTLSAPLTVLPVGLIGLTLEPDRVIGPRPGMGKVTLTGPAPAGGVRVALVNDQPAVARMPGSVLVPAGTTSATFPITTVRVRAATPVSVAASLGGVTRTAVLAVLPSLPLAVVVQPARITGGLAVDGAVYLRDPAPASGTVITLSSSDPALAAAPSSVTVPGGAISASFTVRTHSVGKETLVAIRAAASGVVGSASLTLLAPPPIGTTARIQVLNLPTSDLVYNPADGRLYAGIPAQAAGFAPLSDSITWLDPFTGVLGSAIPIGDDPGNLALAEDGQSLYAAIEGGAAVRRVDLAAGRAGLRFTVGSDPNRGPFLVEDLAVLPGDPDAVAVSRRNRNGLPRHEGVAIYDNGVPRPDTTPGHTGSNVIQFSASAERLYGANTEGEMGFRRMALDGNGVTIIDATPGLISANDSDIRFAGGLIYTTSGRVIDPEARTVVGHFAGIPDDPSGADFDSTLVCADATIGRVFFLVGRGPTRLLQAFDSASLASVGSVSIPNVQGSATRLIRFGRDGLAFRTSGGQLFLIRTGLVPAPALTVGLAPATVTGGESASGTVALSDPAPAGGLVVALESEDPAIAAIPATVTIAAGARSAPFSISTSAVPNGRAVQIRASAGARHAVARLQVLEPVLAEFTVTPNPLARSGVGEGQVVLSGPAPAGGATVTLEAPPSPVSSSVPPSVTVPAGAVRATFPVTNTGLGCGSDAVIQATYGISRQVVVTALPGVNGPVLDSQDVAGGQTVHAAFNADCPLGADLTIPLASDHPALVEVPPTVTLRASQFSVSFDVKTHPVTSPTTVTIRATLPGLIRTVTLRVGALSLSSVSVSPMTLVGGSAATGTVVLNGPAPAGGFAVSLSADVPSVELPAQVVVSAGATTTPFTVQTRGVPADMLATIQATAAGEVRSAKLTIRAVGLSLSSNQVFAGRGVIATLILPAPITEYGAQVTFSTSDPSVAEVGLVGFPYYGATQISGTIGTSLTDTRKTAVISATYQGTTWTATLDVLPVVIAGVTVPGPVVSDGPLPGTYVVSGSTVRGRVSLNYPAPPGGVVVNLGTDLNYIITVPETVTVPEGATSADFPISIRHYDYVVSARVRAEVGLNKEAQLLLLPASFSFVPNPVEPGEVATGILLLSAPAPAGGAAVDLSDTSGGSLSYPSRLTVPAGEQVVTFPIRPSASGPGGSFTVTATSNGQSWSATLTRSP